MYTQQDYQKAKVLRSKLLLYLCAYSLLMIGLIAVALIARIEAAAIIGTILWLCVLILVWGLQGRTVWAYTQFVDHALNGPTHTYQGVLMSMEEDWDKHRWIPARKLMIQEGEFTRTVYLDINKALPDMAMPSPVTFVTQEYFILDLKPDLIAS